MNAAKKIIALLVVCILIISGSYFIFFSDIFSTQDDPERLVPSNIWDYQTTKDQPTDALIVSFENRDWQVLAAASLTPAFMDRQLSTPLMFDDGSESREISIPHDELSINELGNDPETVTANIATRYWSKAEIAVVVNNYEQALWSVPIASYLSAPIMFEPSQATINELDVKCVIALDDFETSSSVSTLIKLDSKENVWRFQLQLYETKGEKCNYIIITNPGDAELHASEYIKWKYVSLASAPLAAYRKAIVQTGDYTVNRTAVDNVYNQLKPGFELVKKDAYNAQKFLIDNNHNPEYLALAGGSYALPDYIFDFHISYFYWSAKLDYLFSSAPYGDIDNKLEYVEYPEEEVAVGRLIGHSLLDVTWQLTRSSFYSDFLTNGRYSSNLADGWENNAAVIEGHRVNQRNSGGPPATNDEPYAPAGDVYNVFKDSGFDCEYYIPRNITDITDQNLAINEIMRRASNSSMMLINAHGGVPGKQTLLEIGIDLDLEHEYLYTIDGDEIVKYDLAPSLVYLIGCDTGSTAFDFKYKEEYLTFGFIHAGAAAYIAPETYQTICYWDYAPEGPESSQAIYFFQNLLDQGMSIGNALKLAKWKGYNDWINTTSEQDDVGPLTVKIYGDPAFIPHQLKANRAGRGQNNSAEINPYNTRQMDGFELGPDVPIDLVWDESITITGTQECGNITINNFGRLIIKNADLRINGIINISGFGSLFVINSNIEVNPPHLSPNTSVILLDGNALVRFINSDFIINPTPVPMIAPLIMSQGSALFTFSTGNFTLNMPPVHRNPNLNYEIEEWVPGTAGALILTQNSVWRIDNARIAVNLFYQYVEGLNRLMGTWYLGTIQGNVELKFENVVLEYEPQKNLLEPLKGTLKFINSEIDGGILTGGLTELIIDNSTLIGEVAVTDMATASIQDSRIIKNVIAGMFSESELTPEPKVDIHNSQIEDSVISSGFAEVTIFNSVVAKGASISENSSIFSVETSFNDMISLMDDGVGNFYNSSLESFNLKGRNQILIKDPQTEIDLLLLFYNTNSSIILINASVDRITIYPEVYLVLTLIGSSISRLRTYWNISVYIDLHDSGIDEVINTGDNNYFSFTFEDSEIANIPFGEKIITIIKNQLNVNVTVNGNPVSAGVEVYYDDNLMHTGTTDENGELIISPVHQTISTAGNQTYDNFQITISYMGFSETRDIILDRSLEIGFELVDEIPPEIHNIDFDPKIWNSNWQIRVQATISDDDVEAIANASIVYTTNDGRSWKEVRMNHVGNGKFQGIIPGQKMGTDVQFYVQTYDRAGNIQKSSIQDYQVGYETLIIIYIIIIVTFIGVGLVVKKLLYNRSAVKNYYNKHITKSNRIKVSKDLDSNKSAEVR
jgi:hypothetical protein